MEHKWAGVSQVISQAEAECHQPSLYHARVEQEQLKASRKAVFTKPLTAEGSSSMAVK
jgi:hypothetical protein